MGVYKDYPYSIYNNGVYNNGAGAGGGGGGDVIGGRTYRTVKIDGLTWLAENLDFKFCDIGGSETPSTPHAWYYDNDEDTYGIDGIRKCGLLYNWYAIKFLEDNKSTLCPGWRVPTNAEWTALANALGGVSTAGTKLKAANVFWATSWGGTDGYGFGVLPAGSRYGSKFYHVGSGADFWTITRIDSKANNRGFNTSAQVFQAESDLVSGHSVRLVKDS